MTAADAHALINNCEEVHDLDCVGGAFTLALTAGNAAVVTNLDDLGAFVLIAAGNNM